MSVQTDNIKQVLKALAKLDRKISTTVIREARKNMRATVRKFIPVFKKISPKRSGSLIRGIKVRSRSRRGVTTTRMVYAVPYAGPLNFRKGSKVTDYMTDEFEKQKAALDKEGANDVIDAFKTVLVKEGFKVI